MQTPIVETCNQYYNLSNAIIAIKRVDPVSGFRVSLPPDSAKSPACLSRPAWRQSQLRRFREWWWWHDRWLVRAASCRKRLLFTGSHFFLWSWKHLGMSLNGPETGQSSARDKHRQSGLWDFFLLKQSRLASSVVIKFLLNFQEWKCKNPLLTFL